MKEALWAKPQSKASRTRQRLWGKGPVEAKSLWEASGLEGQGDVPSNCGPLISPSPSKVIIRAVSDQVSFGLISHPLGLSPQKFARTLTMGKWKVTVGECEIIL